MWLYAESLSSEIESTMFDFNTPHLYIISHVCTRCHLFIRTSTWEENETNK